MLTRAWPSRCSLNVTERCSVVGRYPKENSARGERENGVIYVSHLMFWGSCPKYSSVGQVSFISVRRFIIILSFFLYCRLKMDPVTAVHNVTKITTTTFEATPASLLLSSVVLFLLALGPIFFGSFRSKEAQDKVSGLQHFNPVHLGGYGSCDIAQCCNVSDNRKRGPPEYLYCFQGIF